MSKLNDSDTEAPATTPTPLELLPSGLRRAPRVELPTYSDARRRREDAKRAARAEEGEPAPWKFEVPR